MQRPTIALMMQRLQYASGFIMQRQRYAEAGSNGLCRAWDVVDFHEVQELRQRGRQAPQHAMSWVPRPAEAASSGCLNDPGGTPLALQRCISGPVPRYGLIHSPHAPCALACIYSVLISQRLCTHRTLVICARAWGVRPARSTADPQAILNERQNARTARHHSFVPMLGMHGQVARQLA